MKRCLQFLMAFLVLAGVASFGGCNGARDNAVNMLDKNGDRGFMTKTVQNAGRERKYGLFVPLNYDAKIKYPVIVFLHGVGEGGSDARKNLTVGLAPFVADRADSFPFICIFPQSSGGGWNANSDEASDIMAILSDVQKRYTLDMGRISLTGLSTGGYGTYAIGAQYNTVFAALVPMGSSSSGESFAAQLKDMPIRAYCNGSDFCAGFTGNDRGTINKITDMGGTNAVFTQTNGGGHDCWDEVYAKGQLFDWLLEQHRPGPRAGMSNNGWPKTN